MPEAIRDLLQLAELLAPGISDQTLREVERTVLEVAYASTLSLAYYLDDPDTSDVNWSKPATAIEYMAGWDWIENCHDFVRLPESESWIEYPSRHEHALALLTSHGVGKPGGFIAWTRKEGTYSSLLPRHVIDELERLSETEIQRSLNALYAPFILGGDDGLRFDGGTIRLQIYALFVDQDAHEACYPIHAKLIPDDKADIALSSARKAIIWSILVPLKKAIQARGGFADPASTDLLADFHLRVAPFDASRIPEIIRSVVAAVQGKGQILEFGCVVGDAKPATIALATTAMRTTPLSSDDHGTSQTDGRDHLIDDLLLSLASQPEQLLPVIDLPEAYREPDLLTVSDDDGLIEFGTRNHCWVGPVGKSELRVESGWNFSSVTGPNCKSMDEFLAEAFMFTDDERLRQHIRLTAQGRIRAARLKVNRPANEPEPKPAAMGTREVQRRLLEMCDAGEPYTNVRDLKKLIGCGSTSTVSNAINGSKTLREWRDRHTNRKRRPRASSLTEIVMNNVEQTREPDPAEEAEANDVDTVFARLIQEAKPEERAKLNDMTAEQRRQLVALLHSDPDKYDTILGRNP